MTLVVFHHHFRPGGVRRVIELATPAIAEAAAPRIRTVILATGESPPPSWLKLVRLSLLPHTRLQVWLEPAFSYLSELPSTPASILPDIRSSLRNLLTAPSRDGIVVWAHNLGLGRNPLLARELASFCHHHRVPLISHHHDWWFENRWHHLAGMRRAGFRTLPSIASALFARSPHIAHAAINRADAAVLQTHFPLHSAWLPNPATADPQPTPTRVAQARSWLQYAIGSSSPVWLLPCRLLRRKNIAEALLLTRWLRPEAHLVTTAAPSSPEEQPYAEHLRSAAHTHRWPLRLSILHNAPPSAPSVPELIAASEAVLLTSLQEGFGLPFLEAAAAQRPLIARRLPNISPDLEKLGLRLPQLYSEILIHPSLLDWRAELQRQSRLFASWKQRLPRSVTPHLEPPAFLSDKNPAAPVPFSRLTLAAQIEVLTHPPESSWALCAPLNPFLATWQKRARSRRLLAASWPHRSRQLLSLPSYARRFLNLIPHGTQPPPDAGASRATQHLFLSERLRSAYNYPLLWQSNP